MEVDEPLRSANTKSLSRRNARNVRALQIVCVSEPGAVAIGLRRKRINIDRDLAMLWGNPTENALKVHALMGDYLAVCDRLMRICRIPQAPAGAKGNGKVTLPLDLTPDPVDAPEIVPSENGAAEETGSNRAVPT